MLNAEEALAFFSQSPPRRLSAAVDRQVGQQGGFGRGCGCFAGIFLLAGLALCWIMQIWLLSGEFYLNRGWGAKAQGNIRAISATNMSEGGGKHSKGHPILRIQFRFVTADGQTVDASCYRRGRKDADEQLSQTFGEANPAAIVYVPFHPSWARVDEEGMRLGPTGYFSLFSLFFVVPAAGALVYFRYRRQVARRLLSDGQLTTGRVVKLEETGTRINNRPVFRAVVMFNGAAPGETVGWQRVIGEPADRCRIWMTEKSPVGVLYLADRPGEVMITDLWLAPRPPRESPDDGVGTHGA